MIAQNMPVHIARRNVRLIELYCTFGGILCFLPIIVLFYRDEIGLGFDHFMMGEAFFAACMVLMEVPTGYISDIWQRRYVLMVSAAFHALGTWLLMMATSFPEILLAQGIFAVAIGLFSGTINAYLYDSLYAAGLQDEYRKREGRRTAVSLYMIAASAVAGGFLYKIDPHLPFWVTLLTDLVALVIIWFTVEPERHKLGVQRHPLADMLATMTYCLRGHKDVARLMLLGAVCFSATKMAMWSQQPYYQLAGIDVVWFGILGASAWLLSGLASHHGHILDRFTTPARSLMLIMLTVGTLMILAALFGLIGMYVLGIAGLLLATSMYGMGYPRFQDALNRAVDGSRRATVLSTASLMIQLLNIPLMVLYGLASDTIGISVALAMLGLVLVALAGNVLFRHFKINS